MQSLPIIAELTNLGARFAETEPLITTLMTNASATIERFAEEATQWHNLAQRLAQQYAELRQLSIMAIQEPPLELTRAIPHPALVKEQSPINPLPPSPVPPRRATKPVVPAPTSPQS